MSAVVLYALVTTTMYYLGARALITQWLWSRYPAWLDKLTLCAACSGFWYGLAIGAWGYWRAIPYGPLPGDRWDTVIAIGVASSVTTAIGAQLLLRALAETGSEGGTDAQVQEPEGTLLAGPGRSRTADHPGRDA